MNKIQHSNHIFAVIENGKEKYMVFNYQLLKGADIDYESKTPYTYKSASQNTILSAQLNYTTDKKKATVLNNNPKSDRYEVTSDIHSIYRDRIMSVADKIKIIPCDGNF